MGLFDSIVAILAITVLLTQVRKWSNAEETTLNYTPFYNKSILDNGSHNFSDSKCTQSISRNVPQYIPYTELYNRNPWRDQMRPIMRNNYKLEYHVLWSIEPKCCEGYVQVGRMCVPHCLQPCERGTCVRPNVCRCNVGYQMSQDMKNGRELCVPVCTNGCVNGTCVDVEVCSCNDGYWIDADGFTCRPVCDIECERNQGYCIEPNVCSCRPGYTKVEENESTLHSRCKPVCDRACTNSRCTAPNICSCDRGYEPDESDPRFTCNARCDGGCAFGRCTAPGICTCDDGYKLVNASACEPICSEPCTMGTCVAPETCNCETGYAHVNNSRYVCEPVCKTGCGNGRCTAPNNCTCNDGYATSANGRCTPVCAEECIDGTCTAPNHCTCNDGYATGADDRCAPVCTEECVHGTCTAPNRCTCNDGYAMGADGRCAPVCTEECINGTCTAPNHCTCDDGFAPRNASFCEPVCEGGCRNGDCVGPNQCICHDNFVPSTTRHNFPMECVPACTRNCSGHGVCMIDDEKDDCQCYLGWTGWDCDRPTLCVIMMDFTHSGIDKLVIYNETNSTIMRAHENAPYCYQCDDDFLDTESFCYMVQPEEANTTSTIGCLLSTDLPCYMTPHYDSSTRVGKIVWSLIAIVILILTGLIAAAYLIYRRRQRQKLIRASMSSSLFAQEAFATESLLSENVIYL